MTRANSNTARATHRGIPISKKPKKKRKKRKKKTGTRVEPMDK